MEMTGTDEQGKRLKVLLVDDKQSLLNLGRRTIERYQRENYFVAPCTPIAFESPIAALGILGSLDDLAVVVSDFNMPGMNGEQLLARVREMHPKAIRIIASANPRFREKMTDLYVAHAALEKEPRTYCDRLVQAVNTGLRAYILGEAPVTP